MKMRHRRRASIEQRRPLSVDELYRKAFIASFKGLSKLKLFRSSRRAALCNIKEDGGVETVRVWRLRSYLGQS